MLPKNIELCLPIQAMEVGKVHLSPLKIMPNRNPKPGVENRPIAPLSYVDSNVTLPCLSVLLPLLKITRWDPATGRIDLDLSSHRYIATKLNTLQEYIVSTVHIQQVSWLGSEELDHAAVRSLLQPLVSATSHKLGSVEDTLTLFLHGPNPTLKSAGRCWIYVQNQWTRGSKPTSFYVGQTVRMCVRLHGLCLIPQKGSSIPKFRIQHQVISVICSP